MKSRQRIQKRSFLLFELLVSIALISFCLFPLLKPHAQIRTIEQKDLEHMFLEREAATAFCKLKEEIYEHKIAWKSLVKEETEGVIVDPECAFYKNGYTCRYELICIKCCRRTSNNATLIALEAQIFFQRGAKNIGPYTFFFNVEKRVL